jgi:hypothetical protein
VSDITWQRALDIAIRSRSRETLDTTVLLMVLAGDATFEQIEAELIEIVKNAHPVIRAYWMAPCDCGLDHAGMVRHSGVAHLN